MGLSDGWNDVGASRVLSNRLEGRVSKQVELDPCKGADVGWSTQYYE